MIMTLNYCDVQCHVCKFTLTVYECEMKLLVPFLQLLDTIIAAMQAFTIVIVVE